MIIPGDLIEVWIIGGSLNIKTLTKIDVVDDELMSKKTFLCREVEVFSIFDITTGEERLNFWWFFGKDFGL